MRIRLVTAALALVLFSAQAQALTLNEARQQGRVGETLNGINMFDLAMMQKRIQGNVYGGWSPRVAVPMLLDMYRNKKLKLDELITRTYKIDEINEAYDDMRNGKNIRGVIIHEH